MSRVLSGIWAFFNLNRFHEALLESDILIKFENTVNSHSTRRKLFYRMGHFKEALEISDAEIRLCESESGRPNVWHALLGRVCILLNSNPPLAKQALSELQHLEKEHPKSQHLDYLRGRCHYELKEFDEALHYFHLETTRLTKDAKKTEWFASAQFYQ